MCYIARCCGEGKGKRKGEGSEERQRKREREKKREYVGLRLWYCISLVSCLLAPDDKSEVIDVTKVSLLFSNPLHHYCFSEM
jgi:hypothetical protein